MPQAGYSARSFFEKTARGLVELDQLEDRLNGLASSDSRRRTVEIRIQVVRSNLVASVVVEHDKLRARGRHSIREVKDGACSGCLRKLSLADLAALESRHELRRCSNCGRYVY